MGSQSLYNALYNAKDDLRKLNIDSTVKIVFEEKTNSVQLSATSMILNKTVTKIKELIDEKRI